MRYVEALFQQMRRLAPSEVHRPTSRTRVANRRLSFESLEARQLLATLTDTTLTGRTPVETLDEVPTVVHSMSNGASDDSVISEPAEDASLLDAHRASAALLEDLNQAAGKPVINPATPAPPNGHEPSSDVFEPAGGKAIYAIQGAEFSGSVAYFFDGGQRSPSDFRDAIIDWGDGQISAGTVVLSNYPPPTGDSPVFVRNLASRVDGTHVYAAPGEYAVRTHVTMTSGDQITIEGVASVGHNATFLSIQGHEIAAVQGEPFDGAVAHFRSLDSGQHYEPYIINIDWGDGQSSGGAIRLRFQAIHSHDIEPWNSVPGIFGAQLGGVHVYAAPGTYTVTVRVEAANGDSVKVETTATVTGASPLAPPLDFGEAPDAAMGTGPGNYEMTAASDGEVEDHHVIVEAATQTLMAADGEVSRVSSAASPALSLVQLQPIVDAAITRLAAAGLGPSQLAALSSVRFGIADLPGTTLGLATPRTITLDATAAGHGWFIDPTPLDDAEFATGPKLSTLDSQLHMDLLTAVMHELGHTLGLGRRPAS